MVQWLEAEPDRTAKELFDRLRREHPGMFVPVQLRTLQRRVKNWRRLEVRRLILADPIDRAAAPEAARDDSVQVDSTLLIGSLGEEGGVASVGAR